jgi:hypothetical protein
VPFVVGLRQVDLNGGTVLCPCRSPTSAQPDVVFVPFRLVEEKQVDNVHHVERAAPASLEEALMMSKPGAGRPLVYQQNMWAPLWIMPNAGVPVEAAPEVDILDWSPRFLVGHPQGRAAGSWKSADQIVEPSCGSRSRAAARIGSVTVRPGEALRAGLAELDDVGGEVSVNQPGRLGRRDELRVVQERLLNCKLHKFTHEDLLSENQSGVVRPMPLLTLRILALGRFRHKVSVGCGQTKSPLAVGCKE